MKRVFSIFLAVLVIVLPLMTGNAETVGQKPANTNMADDFDKIPLGKYVVDGCTYEVRLDKELNTRYAVFLKAPKNAKNVEIRSELVFDHVKYQFDDPMDIGITVEAIESKAFYKRTELTKVFIPSSIHTIGKSAFEGCTKLKTVKNGKFVIYFKDRAFKNCASLKRIEIPIGAEKIGKSCFEGCKSLKLILLRSMSLKKSGFGKNCFKGVPAKATVSIHFLYMKKYKKWMYPKTGLPKTVIFVESV